MSLRTTADGGEATEIAVGANAARSFAWVLADSINTRWTSAGTVAVTVALGTALAVGIADVSRWALANCPVATSHFAVGPLSALVARVDALESTAVLGRTALGIALALVSASLDRVALGGKHGSGLIQCIIGGPSSAWAPPQP